MMKIFAVAQTRKNVSVAVIAAVINDQLDKTYRTIKGFDSRGAILEIIAQMTERHPQETEVEINVSDKYICETINSDVLGKMLSVGWKINETTYFPYCNPWSRMLLNGRHLTANYIGDSKKIRGKEALAEFRKNSEQLAKMNAFANDVLDKKFQKPVLQANDTEVLTTRENAPSFASVTIDALSGNASVKPTAEPVVATNPAVEVKGHEVKGNEVKGEEEMKHTSVVYEPEVDMMASMSMDDIMLSGNLQRYSATDEEKAWMAADAELNSIDPNYDPFGGAYEGDYVVVGNAAPAKQPVVKTQPVSDNKPAEAPKWPVVAQQTVSAPQAKVAQAVVKQQPVVQPVKRVVTVAQPAVVAAPPVVTQTIVPQNPVEVVTPASVAYYNQADGMHTAEFEDSRMALAAFNKIASKGLLVFYKAGDDVRHANMPQKCIEFTNMKVFQFGGVWFKVEFAKKIYIEENRFCKKVAIK